MHPAAPPIPGRGTKDRPRPRFEPLDLEIFPEETPAEPERGPRHGAGTAPPPRTQYLKDVSRAVLSRNDSPDVGFDTSLNPYRGCEHGCVYCYARPTHEYLGLSSGLDFETRIVVKSDAPELLRRELSSRRWRPQTLALSGVTDPYQPVERRLRLTRRCLEVLHDFRNPASLITKSDAVVRDIDILVDLARHRAVSVTLSVTTLDSDLARRLEPRAAQPGARLRAIEQLARAGVPVGVNVAPVIPGLTDAEIPAILQAAHEAGASWAGSQMLRLPHGVKHLFDRWLEDHYPLRRRRVLARVRDVRQGRLNETGFGARMRGTGLYAWQIEALFRLARHRTGLQEGPPALSIASFRRPRGAQLDLF